MRPFYLFFVTGLLLYSPLIQAQNYLRVSGPDRWDTPISIEPGWEEYRAHGQLDEVTIIAEPQGIFTEIEFYATISAGPDAWSWNGDYEIVWQFELPGKSIVHDSWLWVGSDIIKADVVDYWTALATYEDIVDRNQDPSFFYRLPDNRYEIRIYPLFEGESRRIKMSFLIPADWDSEKVKSKLLQNLLQSTDYLPPVVGIGMPINDLWQMPQLSFDNNLLSMTDTVVSGTGALLHYLELPGNEFIQANQATLMVDAPLNDNNTFVRTYDEGDESFYQLAFVPDWETVTLQPPKKSLILLDYNDFKTSLSKETFQEYLRTTLGNHFSESDAINAAVATSSGIQFLNNSWWDYDADLFADTLASLLEAQDEFDLEQLLIQGFSWAQSQSEIDHIYVLTANDDFVYPPVADDVFLNIENTIPTDIPIILLDYQDENVSIIYYENEAYQGNEYFYQLLSNSNSELEVMVYRDANETYENLLRLLFPALGFPSGIMDYTTNLENGIAFQRYSIGDVELNPDNNGLILQTGKYLGDFPLEIQANLITTSGEFYTISNTVEPQDILTGDTLMREMWYGPHLKELELLAGSNEDRKFIIEQSIQERVLTGLTAFLALEPSQGGEPCIDCLLNSGEIIFVSVDELFDPSDAEVLVNPNPATDLATIQLIYTAPLNSADWNAGIYDLSGRLITPLESTNIKESELEWQWRIGAEIGAGIYFCMIESEYAKLTAKVIVIPY